MRPAETAADPPAAAPETSAAVPWTVAPLGQRINAALTRASTTRLVALFAAAVVVVGALGVLVGGGNRTVTGVFVLRDYASALNGCQGEGGYSDIGPGTPATLKDENGKLLASTVLGPGSGPYPCTYALEFTDVPGNAAFYVFEVGRRGEISSSHDEMVKSNWTVSASLGD